MVQPCSYALILEAKSLTCAFVDKFREEATSLEKKTVTGLLR